MIVDAHYHLDPRLESVERLLAQMQEHGIDRVALIAAPCDPLHVGKAGAALGKAMRCALEGGAPWLGRILYCSTVHRSGRVSFLGRSSASAIRDGSASRRIPSGTATRSRRWTTWRRCVRSATSRC